MKEIKTEREENMEFKVNSNGMPLKENSSFFPIREREKAIELARQKRSYVDRCYNGFDVWIGFYVPQ